MSSIINGFESVDLNKIVLEKPHELKVATVVAPMCGITYNGKPMLVMLQKRRVPFSPKFAEKAGSDKKPIKDWMNRPKLSMCFESQKEEIKAVEALEKDILTKYMLGIEKVSTDRDGKETAYTKNDVDRVYADVKGFLSRVKRPAKDKPYEPFIQTKLKYEGKTDLIYGTFRFKQGDEVIQQEVGLRNLDRWFPAGCTAECVIIHVASYMNLTGRCIEMVVIQGLFDPTSKKLLEDFVCGGPPPAKNTVMERYDPSNPPDVSSLISGFMNTSMSAKTSSSSSSSSSSTQDSPIGDGGKEKLLAAVDSLLGPEKPKKEKKEKKKSKKEKEESESEGEVAEVEESKE